MSSHAECRWKGALVCTLLPGLLALAGCNLNNPGVDPPTGRINFPTALALSSQTDASGNPRYLYVASSNFDLRYNAGVVDSFDIAAVDARLAETCTGDCLVDPAGADSDVLRSEVLIGSYASGLALAPDGSRLYVPVRSDSTLSFIDVSSDGKLSCGGGAPGVRQHCTDAFKASTAAAANARGVTLPADPVGIAVGDLSTLDPMGSGNFVVLAHGGGDASLFLDQGAGASRHPNLVHVLGSLPDYMTGIALQPGSNLTWLTSANDSGVQLVGIAIDSTDDLGRSFLYDAGGLSLGNLDTAGTGDTRAVAFDPRGRPRVYILSRKPEALLVADLDLSVNHLTLRKVIAVGSGPSRLHLADVDGRVMAFVSDFDSRDLYVIDVDLGEVLGVIRGMSGPFSIALDAGRSRIYVADFRASDVGVVSLTPLLTCLDAAMPMTDQECSPVVLGTLGVPRPVEQLQ